VGEASKSGPSPFLRQATGLVREVSLFGFFTYSMNILSIQFLMYYVASLVPLIGGNLIVGFSLYALLLLLLSVLYYTFTVAIPRSGGDYVFVSRALHPSVGFVSNFVQGILLLIFVGVNGTIFVTIGLDALFGYLGVTLNNHVLLGYISVMGQPTNAFVIGFVYLLAVLALAILVPPRYIFGIQKVGWVTVLAASVAMIAALLAHSHAAYVSAFNRFASDYMGQPNDYFDGVVASATAAGWTIPPASLAASVLLLPAFALSGYMNWTAQIAGEVRNIKKSIIVAQFGGILIWLGFLAVFLAVLYHTIGFRFMSAIDYLFYNAPSKIPLPAYPYATFLIAIATNPAVAAIILIPIMIEFFLYPLAIYYYMSRGLLAYSMDRLLPEWFARVSDRTHTPTNAMITATVVSLIIFVFVVLPATAPFALLLSSVYTWGSAIFPVFLLALSAVVIKKTRPNIHSLLPIKGFGIQVIGLVVMVISALIVYLQLTNPIYGANSPTAIAMVAGSVILLTIIFVAARVKRGKDISLAFSEIPPE
jgi:APA family basic amino acid/polyamine antiporter